MLLKRCIFWSLSEHVREAENISYTMSDPSTLTILCCLCTAWNYRRLLHPFPLDMEGKSDSGGCHWGIKTLTRDCQQLSIPSLFLFLSLFSWAALSSFWALVPDQRSILCPNSRRWSSNHWTIRELLQIYFFIFHYAWLLPLAWLSLLQIEKAVDAYQDWRLVFL